MAHWVLFSAPHRTFFLAGIIQALVAMTYWVIDVGARHAGLWAPTSWPLPAPWLHGLILLYGVFPFFVFGFILTAGPRWQGRADTPSSVHRPAFLLLAAGWLLADFGLLFPFLLPTGLLVALGGWLVALRFLWSVALEPNDDRRHIRLVASALSIGAAGIVAFAAFAAGLQPALGAPAIAVGLWGFLLPVFLIVIHRMLPFFTSSVIRDFVPQRPFWALATLLGASLVHGFLAAMDWSRWTWSVDLPAAFAAVRLTFLWRLKDSFAATILAVLHVGFAWVGVAFALFAAHSLALLAGAAGLGLAPLHALTLGFFSSVAIGMGTRVTLGHSGKPVSGDGVMWGAFWALQAAAGLRMAAEFVHLPGVFNLSFLAALLWLGAFGTWAAEYAPNLWRPRADGRPG